MMTAASCVQELANGPQHQEGAVVYKAIAEGTDSKAVLGTNGSGRPQSMWEKGDKITIHNGERGYEFTTSSEDYSPVADFVYNGDDFSAENGVIAVYPAGNYDADIEARSVMVTIPSHQQAVENSYDRNAVPAVAYSTDNSLHFYNAGGLLKFTMNQMNVTKVRFSSNESVVTGSYYAICRSVLSDGPGFHYNYIPDVPEYNINYAELYAPEGDTFHKGSTYYISAIPDTYDGFHIEFFAADGSLVFEARYNGKVHLSRASILNLGTLGKEGWDGSTDLMYVVGSYNEWRHDKNLYLFDYNGTEKFYSGVVDFNAYARWSTEFNEFKLTGGVWGVEEYSQPEETDQYGTETNVLDLVEGGGNNINAYQQYRFYHFTLDKNNSTLTKNYAFNSIGIIGSFSAWSEDVDMNYNPDTQRFWVDVDFAEDGEMKFRTDDMWDVSFGYDDKSGYLTEKGDNILYTAGQYRLYLNMNNLSAISYEFNAEAYGTEENAGQWDPWADEPQPDPIYGWALIGEFNGWNGDAMMTEVQPGQWEIKEFPLEARQQWKLRKDGSWDVNYGGPGDVEPYEIAVGQTFKATSYGKNMVVSTSGMYDIYFNENKETILVLEAGSPLPEPSGTDYIDEYGINHGPGVEIDGVVWAPVNCGYHTEDFKYGKLYQWGRKYGQGYYGSLYDPDMNYIEDYYDAGWRVIESAPVSLEAAQSEDNESIFYKSTKEYNYNWFESSDYNLWNSGTEENPVKTEYDPCPKGWRVPTLTELSELTDNFTLTTDGIGRTGYMFEDVNPVTSEASQLFFPYSGYSPSNGYTSNNRGGRGYYWSSNLKDVYADYLIFYSETIRLTAYNRAHGLSVRCVQDDSELIPVADITINMSSMVMCPGTSSNLYATIAPYDANHQSAYWSSSDTSVAIVDQAGNVTAVSPGNATITAMAGMKTATCEVTVSEEAPSDDYIDEYGINHGPGVEIDGVVWAPVNCGYHAEDFKYGKLYQWGRKYGQGYEGPLYENGENVGTYSDATVPIIEGGGVSITTGNHKSQENVFYTSTSEYNYDWVYPQDDKLWNSGTESKPVKTDYDPCPSGWRVPTNAELYELTNNYSEWIANSEGQYGRWFSGASQYDERVPRIFLPAAGRLQHSYNADARGDRGLYWSSQPYINSASNVISTTTYVNNIDNSRRARGCSVRCVKDDSSYEPGNGGSQSGDIEDMPEIELF